MRNRSLIRTAGWLAVLFLVPAAARAQGSFESDLLQKYQWQNRKAAVQVTQDVEKGLAQANALSPSDPAKALRRLRQVQAQLDAADKLQRADRAAMARKLAAAVRDVKARAESQMVPPTATAPKGTVLGGPVVFVPNMASVPSQFSGQVTPVVSPGRRWVRIGFGGAFIMRTR